MREGGNRTSESGGHFDSNWGRYVQGDKSAFIEINVQPAEGGEGGKNVFQANDLFKFTLKNNQGVVRVLKHGGREDEGKEDDAVLHDWRQEELGVGEYQLPE